MINGLGVLGWGVGGIEAEAAMLGQPMSMLIPQVVGFKLTGELPEGATATDLVLTVTQMLREHGVVGKFVEFYGAGRRRTCRWPTARRSATWRRSSARPARSSRSTQETLRYLEFSGRPKEQIELVEAYAREQGLWHDADSEEPTYSETLELDLGDVVPVAGRPEAPAGPRRADRVQGRRSGWRSRTSCPTPEPTRRAGVDEASDESFPASDPPAHNGDGTGHDDCASRRGAAPAACRSPSASSITVAGHARGRHGDRARPRPRGDRRDHVVHEHVEPVGDARRRPAGPERGRARA